MAGPRFQFCVTVDGWEQGSVFDDFCRKNKIKAKLVSNAGELIRKVTSTNRRFKLTKQQVVAVEDFIKKNPKLNNSEVVRRLKLPCSNATIWRIRENKHRLQSKKK